MKVLIFGGTGQVGFELQQAFGPVADVILPQPRVDLTDFAALEKTLADVRPDLVINAAAYTAVDKAETERELATKINAEAPGALARAAAKLNAPFIHYSTDYVFDGQGTRPFREDDATGPLNHYGASKLAGEEAVHASHPQHFIFRTSWVYAPHGRNFPKTMLRLAQERDNLQVVDDQVGAPTSAALIARATVHAALRASSKPELYGTYHVVASGETNWFEYAAFLMRKAHDAGLISRIPKLEAVTSAQFLAAATRPKNSRLANGKFAKAFDFRFPDWRAGVEELVAALAKPGFLR